jgi:hypothetical protein
LLKIKNFPLFLYVTQSKLHKTVIFWFHSGLLRFYILSKIAPICFRKYVVMCNLIYNSSAWISLLVLFWEWRGELVFNIIIYWVYSYMVCLTEIHYCNLLVIVLVFICSVIHIYIMVTAEVDKFCHFQFVICSCLLCLFCLSILPIPVPFLPLCFTCTYSMLSKHFIRINSSTYQWVRYSRLQVAIY